MATTSADPERRVTYVFESNSLIRKEVTSLADNLPFDTSPSMPSSTNSDSLKSAYATASLRARLSNGFRAAPARKRLPKRPQLGATSGT